MCGIFACHHHPDVHGFKPTALRMAKAARHRGPDWTFANVISCGNHVSNQTILAHERLSIVGVDTGAQPICSRDSSIVLAVNGEIYNHRILRKQLDTPYDFSTGSDCEVIIPIYQEHGAATPSLLDGMFSWVLYDRKLDRTLAARDPIGITSFYMGTSWKTPGTKYFASELKSLFPVCDQVMNFPPGHVYDSSTDSLTRYFAPAWLISPTIPTAPADLMALRHGLEAAVRKRMMAEVPFGVLLSGGLDSSLVTAIAQREMARVNAANGGLARRPPSADGSDVSDTTLVGIDDEGELTTLQWTNKLHSFSIGLPGAPDSAAACEVAAYLGTKHHAFEYSVAEGLDALRDVIYHLETYDVTTIRASTPMFLLSRKIKATGVKMLLSGEGSDEIFGGYLYFHAAPNREALHHETVRRVQNLHLADCLRANKSTAAWGVEARVPFLDKEFLALAMSIDPAEKMSSPQRMEKYLLRKAFDTTHEPDTEPYLPQHILWRQKEQFSDGVGYGWIDTLKATAEEHITDEMMNHPKPEWGDDIPETKEAYWYRCMFDEHFPPYCANTVSRWTPTWSQQSDPSGRAISSHHATY